LTRREEAGWVYTSCAGEIRGHGDGDVKIFGLGLGEAVYTGDIVGDREVGLTCGTEGVA
jgi:hypothetical protein